MGGKVDRLSSILCNGAGSVARKLRLHVSKILLLFAPAQHPCLVEDFPFRFVFFVDHLPLRSARCSGSIRAAAAHNPVLQDSRREHKLPLILATFCTGVETYLRLMSCGFPREPRGCSMHRKPNNDTTSLDGDQLS